MPFASVGKYRIYYVEEGEGFPLVLIHGLAGDHEAWAPQIEAFRGRSGGGTASLRSTAGARGRARRSTSR